MCCSIDWVIIRIICNNACPYAGGGAVVMYVDIVLITGRMYCLCYHAWDEHIHKMPYHVLAYADVDADADADVRIFKYFLWELFCIGFNHLKCRL